MVIPSYEFEKELYPTPGNVSTMVEGVLNRPSRFFYTVSRVCAMLKQLEKIEGCPSEEDKNALITAIKFMDLFRRAPRGDIGIAKSNAMLGSLAKSCPTLEKAMRLLRHVEYSDDTPGNIISEDEWAVDALRNLDQYPWRSSVWEAMLAERLVEKEFLMYPHKEYVLARINFLKRMIAYGIESEMVENICDYLRLYRPTVGVLVLDSMKEEDYVEVIREISFLFDRCLPAVFINGAIETEEEWLRVNRDAALVLSEARKYVGVTFTKSLGDTVTELVEDHEPTLVFQSWGDNNKTPYTTLESLDLCSTQLIIRGASYRSVGY